MTSDSARTLVLPLIVLVSIAVGVFIGNSLSKRVDAPTDARAETLRTDDLESAMRALTEELARARRDSGGLTNVPVMSGRTEAVPAQADAVARELREATKQLVAALDLLRTTSRGISSDGALIEPAYTPDPALLEAFTPDDGVEQKAPYMMWTYQQVMDRFGKPLNVIRRNASIEWSYRSASGKSIAFSFADGRVFEIECNMP